MNPLARLQSEWDAEAALNPLLAADPRPSLANFVAGFGAVLLVVMAGIFWAAAC